MSNVDTIAWIFLAIWFWDKSPVTRLEISHSANAINHAVPLESELDLAIGFLTARSLIEQDGDLYSLTETGKQLIESTSHNAGNIFDIWAALKKSIPIAGTA